MNPILMILALVGQLLYLNTALPPVKPTRTSTPVVTVKTTATIVLEPPATAPQETETAELSATPSLMPGSPSRTAPGSPPTTETPRSGGMAYGPRILPPTSTALSTSPSPPGWTLPSPPDRTTALPGADTIGQDIPLLPVTGGSNNLPEIIAIGFAMIAVVMICIAWLRRR